MEDCSAGGARRGDLGLQPQAWLPAGSAEKHGPSMGGDGGLWGPPGPGHLLLTEQGWELGPPSSLPGMGYSCCRIL